MFRKKFANSALSNYYILDFLLHLRRMWLGLCTRDSFCHQLQGCHKTFAMTSHSGNHSKTLGFVVGSVCLFVFHLSLLNYQYFQKFLLCALRHTAGKTGYHFLLTSVFSPRNLTQLRQLLSANFLGLLNFACINSKMAIHVWYLSPRWFLSLPAAI